jgi:hypothetical protein
VQDRQKSFADVHRIDRNYDIGDKVFLQVKLHKSSIKFGKGDKLSPKFVGPFEVVENKGLVSALYTPGVMWNKSSIHLVCPWGKVSSQGVVT